jgi:4-aminobutyrate aminotransferase-like enzyme
LAEVVRLLDQAELSGAPVGGILAEPIQGRGGDVVPPASFLPSLRRICDERGILLILDEIYTGFGRTGRWFACEHWRVVPDLIVVGKALTGGMPFAACIGTDAVMNAWPRSTGEALHTSTFLGHPLGCAAALASIEVIRREGLVERAATEGDYALGRLRETLQDEPGVAEVRGLGLMIGIELVDPVTGEPDAAQAGRVVVEALRRGVLVLSGGVAGNVLSISPPLAIERELLRHGLAVIAKNLGST